MQQELGQAIVMKARIDMESAMEEASSYIDLHPLDIPAKVTEVSVDESAINDTDDSLIKTQELKWYQKISNFFKNLFKKEK